MRIEQRVIGGVQTFEVTPEGPIAPENRRRVLINLHGGAYIVNGGQDASASSELHVFEALWHDFLVNPGLPEAREGWDLLVRFFDRHLGR